MTEQNPAHLRHYFAGKARKLQSEMKMCLFIKKKENAEGRNRTDMGLLPPDFESGAYTNFATPACEYE